MTYLYAMRDLLYGQMTVGTRTPVKLLKDCNQITTDNGTQLRYRWSIEERSGPPMSEWQNIYTIV